MSRIRVWCLAVLVGALWACDKNDGVSPEDAPTLSAVSPSTGTVGTELRITGSRFQTGADVFLDELRSPSVDVTGATEIFAGVPTGVLADQVYSVTVRNPDGGEATLDSVFTAVTPTLAFVNSATKPSGNPGSTVIIEGAPFGDTQGSGQVLFSDGAGGTVSATIAAADDWTDTFIVTTVPAAAETGPVVVQTGTGVSNALTFTVTENATFSPSTITWAETQALPDAASGHQALYVPIDDAGGQTVRYVYVSGGAGNDDTPRQNVDFAVIQNDATLSGWTDVTGLTAARSFHAMAAATPFNSKAQGSGHLYVLGGIDAPDGEPVATVFTAPLNNDGTIGAMSDARSLPIPLHSLGAVVFRSALYVVGGATTNDAPSTGVYRAWIDTLGNLGAWEQLTSLPMGRAYHGVQSFGGFLYTVGGESAAIAPSDGNFVNNDTKLSEVLYAKIDLRTGDLAASWTVNANSMNKSRSKHTALAAGGNFFVSAGLYAAAGTGSTENIWAQINSDGTVESFAGATGSNTLLSVGGVNLFNHAAISYVDGNGVAHVMVLGGDDVNNPGTKQSKVFYY